MPNNRTEYFKQYLKKNKEKLRKQRTDWAREKHQATYILPRIKEISKELSRLMKNVKVRREKD